MAIVFNGKNKSGISKEVFGSVVATPDGSYEVISAAVARYSNFAGRANPRTQTPEGARSFRLVFNLNDPEDASRAEALTLQGYKLYTSKYDTEPIKYLDVKVNLDSNWPPKLFYAREGANGDIVYYPIPYENVGDLDNGDVDAWVIEFRGSPCKRRDGSDGMTPYLSKLIAFSEPDPFEMAMSAGLGQAVGSTDAEVPSTENLPFEL